MLCVIEGDDGCQLELSELRASIQRLDQALLLGEWKLAHMRSHRRLKPVPKTEPWASQNETTEPLLPSTGGSLLVHDRGERLHHCQRAGIHLGRQVRCILFYPLQIALSCSREKHQRVGSTGSNPKCPSSLSWCTATWRMVGVGPCSRSVAMAKWISTGQAQ